MFLRRLTDLIYSTLWLLSYAPVQTTRRRTHSQHLLDELQAKADAGIDAFKGGEKTRIAWEGIAVWPYLSHTYKALKALGTNMVGSTYPSAWSIHYEPGDLKAMAAGYIGCYYNTSLERRVDVLGGVMENTKCTGILYHNNRSCKNMAVMNVEMAEMIRERTKTPFASFRRRPDRPS